VELVLALVIGVLFGTGTFLMLRRNLIRVVLGLGLLSHGANLMLMAGAGVPRGRAPILGAGAGAVVDPLPQALVLTAIVIGFGVTAFLLVLAYRHIATFGDVDVLGTPMDPAPARVQARAAADGERTVAGRAASRPAGAPGGGGDFR